MPTRGWKYLLAAVIVSMLSLGTAPPATASNATITVSFADWHCNATGGGSVAAVQMGSQYGSVPKSSGRTIKIRAKLRAANNLTGVIWCKRPWYRGGMTTPVYNINQGLWVDRNGQHFNV